MRYFLRQTTNTLTDEWTVDTCTPGFVLRQNTVSEQSFLSLFFLKLFVY